MDFKNPNNYPIDDYTKFLNEWVNSLDKKSFERENQEKVNKVRKYLNKEDEILKKSSSNKEKYKELKESKKNFKTNDLNNEQKTINKNLNNTKDKKIKLEDKKEKIKKSIIYEETSKTNLNKNIKKSPMRIKREYANKINDYKGNIVVPKPSKEDYIKMIGSKELHAYEKVALSSNVKFKSLSTFHKAGALVAVGAGIGVTRRVFGSEKRNEEKGLTADVIEGTAIAGLGVVALDLGTKNIANKKVVVDSLKKTSGIDDKIISNLIGSEKKIYETAKTKSFKNSYLSKNSQKLNKRVLGSAAIFIAATSMIDMGVNNKYKKDAEKQNKKDEKKIQDMQKESQKRNRMPIMGPPGDLVLDMWNDRMGHMKMGNAKFN